MVSAQGEAATKFYVVTEGGFDITVATAAAPAVLVAQAGYLPYISHISPLYLPYISPISPLYLPYISAVLVAQVGPSGTFNSKALMGKGEARVTATAAVHSEAFVLTRYPRP